MPNGLPPATAYHNTPMRLFNRAMRLLWQVGIGKASLSERDLVAAARQASGLEFFGDTSFVENLRRLLHGLETEAELNPLDLHAVEAAVRIKESRPAGTTEITAVTMGPPLAKKARPPGVKIYLRHRAEQKRALSSSRHRERRRRP